MALAFSSRSSHDQQCRRTIAVGFRVRIAGAPPSASQRSLPTPWFPTWPHRSCDGNAYNCQQGQFWLYLPGSRHLARDDFRNASRELRDTMAFDCRTPDAANHNIVPRPRGRQYDCTSLASGRGHRAPAGQTTDGLTPYLAACRPGRVSFSNGRPSLLYYKGPFCPSDGRYPSAHRIFGNRAWITVASLQRLSRRAWVFDPRSSSPRRHIRIPSCLIHNLELYVLY